MENQWLAYTLAMAGFQVRVITNADEVEPQYRCLPWSPFPTLPEDCLGSITVHSTSKEGRRHYIPYANPYLSKLAAIASEVIRDFGCDLIYSYYLEPYAVAAHLASRWTGVPYGLRHAGSDVGVLFQSHELQATYREVILAEDFVVATPATYRSFLHLGIQQNQLYLPAPCLPSGVFTPDAAPLNINALLAWMGENLPLDSYYDPFRRLAQKPFRESVPTIGIYGKIGTVKGSFDLVEALGHLKSEGVAFQFLTLTQGTTSLLAEFALSIEGHGLADVTWLLPFLPHWEIPSFLRTCTAVCFLEQDFLIPIHTPRIPQEVFACGTCQVLSHEVAEKLTYRDRLQHSSNVFLVDPHNHEELAAILRTIVQEPVASRQIGQQGFNDIGHELAQCAEAAQDWQKLFSRIYSDVQQRRQAMSLAGMQSYLAHLYTDGYFRKLSALAPEASFENYSLTETEKQALLTLDRKLLAYFATSLKMKQKEYLCAVYPATFALPKTLMERLFSRFFHHYPTNPYGDQFARIVDFGVFLEQMLEIDELAPCYAGEVVKYERLHYIYTYQPTPEDSFSANIQRPTESLPLLPEAIPMLLPGVYRETFTYPVVSLVEVLTKGDSLEDQTMQPDHYHLVFQRELHSLTLNVFTLNTKTALLLDLCQEGRSVATIIEMVQQQIEEAGLADDILAMFSALQEQQIIGVQHGS
ncbi:MAG TPA: glycosyltransferase [Ktedonobacteraceae bacterium]|nr:glycosyltransferase [Ktedonobacteraceae bacterium]